MNPARRLITMALAAILLAGCPSIWRSAAVEKPLGADELYQKAEGEFKSKNYPQAIELLERLKSAHPDFGKTPEVYLKLADASYDEGSYEKAAARYLQFLELYPAHKEVPRAKFNIAMCYFKQIKNTDLDSRVVKLALDSFKQLANDANAGEWAKKAEENARECLKKLAEKEIYKAQTYLSVSNYKAARLAAQRVLEEFPKLGYDDKAQELIKKLKGK
ncbi:MAG: outer membrane protein assembly factor BamD [Deltaproteobacteria bacterium]|nr:outer membrane protein assembly factor BamD [Deltaproteobacteria bacterium]